VGWMVVMEEWLTAGGPLGAILAFLVGGLALVPVALVYGRLAQRIPEAASEIAYTAAVFPPAVSFLTGWTMTFAYLVVCPFEAVAIGRLAAYTFPALNSYPLYQVGGYRCHSSAMIWSSCRLILPSGRGVAAIRESTGPARCRLRPLCWTGLRRRLLSGLEGVPGSGQIRNPKPPPGYSLYQAPRCQPEAAL